MTTLAAKNSTYCNAYKKESVWNKLMNIHRENKAISICGILALNASTNVYPLYKTLTEK